MRHEPSFSASRPPALVIGAGVGGLACAMRLLAAGFAVTVLDSHDQPGGKLRSLPSPAGPVDAGPTVLTLRAVFEDLFAACGSRLSDRVTLQRQAVLARHFWPDGSRLDLFDDPARSAAAIETLAGQQARRAFERFHADTSRLYDLFDAPMIQDPEPSLARLSGAAIRAPGLLPLLRPGAQMAGYLAGRFRDPRLAQLFGRYATYVGGDPALAPALLTLIWQAEARGVWTIAGGMHRLAQAMADEIAALGGRIRLGETVARIDTEGASVTGVTLRGGERLAAPVVVFNGDPRALACGFLGADVRTVAAQTQTLPRSLSARVWSFAATPEGPPLLHHNVFFTADPGAEFAALRAGQMPAAPTIYVCAQDRGTAADAPGPGAPERFELILNAAPLSDGAAPPEEAETCLRHTFQTLARFGLRFDPVPGPEALTTPAQFDSLFPGSAGSLYGQSPNGLTAALQRPRARTPIRGLYLAGGGTHPGAGLPMATLSGRHAAEAIIADRASI